MLEVWGYCGNSPDRNRGRANFTHQIKTTLGRMASDPASQWKTHAQDLLAQMSTESGKEIPLCTEVAKASQRVTRFQREFQQSVDARQNAERLFTDTRKNAIRIAGELEMAEQQLNASGATGVAHTDSKDRALRSDLAELLEPDAASRVILDDMGVIGDENELDLTEDERTAYQAHKKKFAEDVVAAVQSFWGSLRQIVTAKRAEARETQRQWKKKRKVEIVEIGSRIDETPDVSDLGDMGDPGPTTEQQALQKQAALCESINEESRRRRLNSKNHPQSAPRRVRG